MLSGTVEQIGTTRSFFEAPRTAAVARFFGWQSLDGDIHSPEQAAIVAFNKDADHVTGVVEELVDAGTHLAVKVRTDLDRSSSSIHRCIHQRYS